MAIIKNKRIEDISIEVEWDRFEIKNVVGVWDDMIETLNELITEKDYDEDELYLMGLMMVGRYAKTDKVNNIFYVLMGEVLNYRTQMIEDELKRNLSRMVSEKGIEPNKGIVEWNVVASKDRGLIDNLGAENE